MTADAVVFDLETQKSFDEVGGRANLHLLRVSVAGIFSYATSEYRIFTEWETPELGDILRRADRVIGFNIKRFDLPVLEPYLKRKLEQLPVLDIMENVERHLGHRLSLDNLLQATLGEGKTGSGLEAISHFRNGDMERLKSYCISDVRLTKDLYEFGKSNGFIRCLKNHEPARIPVSW